jgi:hypothetical protein
MRISPLAMNWKVSKGAMPVYRFPNMAPLGNDRNNKELGKCYRRRHVRRSLGGLSGYETIAIVALDAVVEEGAMRRRFQECIVDVFRDALVGIGLAADENDEKLTLCGAIPNPRDGRGIDASTATHGPAAGSITQGYG